MRENKPLPQLDRDTLDRFWSKVERKAPDECWPWIAFCNKAGYGKFGIGKDVFLAPRVAFGITTGTDPKKLFVMHTCDNPSCCNPSHLKSGTHKQNMRDMRLKGRSISKNRVTPETLHQVALKRDPSTFVRGDNHWTRRNPGALRGIPRKSFKRLSDEKVIKIKELLSANTLSYNAIARIFGCSGTHISAIAHGEVRASVLAAQ